MTVEMDLKYNLNPNSLLLDWSIIKYLFFFFFLWSRGHLTSYIYMYVSNQIKNPKENQIFAHFWHFSDFTFMAHYTKVQQVKQ